jgi:(R,R)-butanediol dehydrogenase/meso-butanediol dehydrogenase/diacetyl reductase
LKALQFHVNVPRFIAAKGLCTIFGKQVFYKGPVKTVQVVDIPEPDIPSKDWVKIKTIYCGFCGSDLNLILLHDSPTASPFTSFPCITGHEIVGEIVETGSGVEEFSPNDLVALNPVLGCAVRDISPPCPSCRGGRSGSCENTTKGPLGPGMFLGITSGLNGGFAPYVVAHKSQLHKLPEGVASEAAVMTEPLAVALQAVFDNMPLDDEKILVIGGGVIGNLIIQSIRYLVPRCHISVIEPSPFAAEFALNLGADELIKYKNVFQETARISDATVYKPMLGKEILMGGFHRIYDTVGNTSTLNLSMRLLRALGVLSVVGIGGDVKLDLTPLWLKLQTVKGVYSYGRVTYNGEEQHVFDIALQLLKQKNIQADLLVTHKFRIDDYHQMIQVNLNKGKHKAIKTVVSFTK